ncbi:YaeQ family protein [Geomonas sp. RF6]|uniref:YaeQ family protein n=1 Tax=Geomonas sp. RF6 TaxID=2897342 RepID=UPI001E48A255|nr:YaeQ family protein [Geomonas sp. RF6]UFS69385.1 YaeQ family protein [Geomonas sp. RF6]
MALPSTVHKASIQLSDIDRGVYESLQATVARHPSETAERLVARLLAYAIFHEEGVQFTKGICVGEEPDLWSKEADGRVLSWIEVGVPEPERVAKAARHAGRVALLACGNSLPHWERHHLPKLVGVGNLTVATVEQAFINRLAALVQRSISWEITITEGTVYLQIGGESLETPIAVHCGAR